MINKSKQTGPHQTKQLCMVKQQQQKQNKKQEN